MTMLPAHQSCSLFSSWTDSRRNHRCQDACSHQSHWSLSLDCEHSALWESFSWECRESRGKSPVWILSSFWICSVWMILTWSWLEMRDTGHWSPLTPGSLHPWLQWSLLTCPAPTSSSLLLQWCHCRTCTSTSRTPCSPPSPHPAAQLDSSCLTAWSTMISPSLWSPRSDISDSSSSSWLPPSWRCRCLVWSSWWWWSVSCIHLRWDDGCVHAAISVIRHLMMRGRLMIWSENRILLLTTSLEHLLQLL